MTPATAIRQLRVVIADDSDDLRLMVRMRLELSSGIEVCGDAPDGVEAVALVRAMQPDAVVLDLAMPRMDGLQAARHIREEFPDILLIAMTGYTQSSVGQEALDAGFDHFLTKGDTLLELEALLRAHAES